MSGCPVKLVSHRPCPRPIPPTLAAVAAIIVTNLRLVVKLDICFPPAGAPIEEDEHQTPPHRSGPCNTPPGCGTCQAPASVSGTRGSPPEVASLALLALVPP